MFYLFALIILISSCKKNGNSGQSQTSQSDWTIFTSKNSSLDPVHGISSLFIDNTGIIWVCDGQLNRYDGNKWTVYTDESSVGLYLSGVNGGINLNNVYWFSSMTGLIRFQNNSRSVYTMSNSSLPSAGINGIVTDPMNNLWMATDGGIVKYNAANNWKIFDESNAPMTCKLTKRIKAFADGTIWATSSVNDQVCPGVSTACLTKYNNGN
jgi:ligand-binding sensor domain-containing protein